MDKDNLHLYDRFKSLERLQRVSATFTASNTSRSTCSNSNTPTTAYSTSRTELYFNCFFAIKIIVLSGFSLRFIFAIFSLCVSLFLPLCPYAICDVQFPLCLSSFACIFVHLPPPPPPKKLEPKYIKHDLCLVCGFIGYTICQRNGKYGPLGWHFSLSHLFVSAFHAVKIYDKSHFLSLWLN